MRRGLRCIFLFSIALWLVNCGEQDGTVGTSGTVRRIFVTSQAFDGNLGGLSGADVRCQSAALGAGLGGTWVAWLSDSSRSAIDRISDVGPWFLVDKVTLVFANKAQLSARPTMAIRVSEKGQDTPGEVWTGTRVGGLTSGLNCSNWTSSDFTVNGTFGNTTSNIDSWTEIAGALCAQSRHLYCIEQ